MIIRAISNADFEKIREIHSQYYQNEFEFPDFYNRFICAFVVATDTGDIVSVGGIRNIAESIVLTDKSFSTRLRRSALYKVLDASEFIARDANIDELHAFVQDSNWEKHLRKVGFLPTKGKSLVLEL